jgi:hypothetical protein
MLLVLAVLLEPYVDAKRDRQAPQAVPAIPPAVPPPTY